MTSYSREAAVFSQSHFSSKELNSTEQSAKKCKCRVGLNYIYILEYHDGVIWIRSLKCLPHKHNPPGSNLE